MKHTKEQKESVVMDYDTKRAQQLVAAEIARRLRKRPWPMAILSRVVELQREKTKLQGLLRSVTEELRFVTETTATKVMIGELS